MKNTSSQKHRRAQELDLPSVAGLTLPADAPPMRVRTRPLWTGSGRHDLVYVSGLVHDASFRLDEVYESGEWLVIPINRERHELKRQKGERLACVRSEIMVGPVKWWTVELDGRSFIYGFTPEEVIFGLQCSSGGFVVESSNDEEIVIDCHWSKLWVRVTEEAEVRLVDVPPKRRKTTNRKKRYLIRPAWPLG